MTEPTKYRKRPVVVDAMLYGPTPTDAYALTEWMSANLYVGLVGNALDPASLRYPDQADGDDSTPDKGWYIDPADGALMIRTLEGDMRVAPGDYVIRGVQGEFYPCKLDIFLRTYEAPDAAPTQDDFDRSLRIARFAADDVAIGFTGTPAQRTGALVKRALGALLTHGLIVLTPPESWAQWIDIDQRHPFESEAGR